MKLSFCWWWERTVRHSMEEVVWHWSGNLWKYQSWKSYGTLRCCTLQCRIFFPTRGRARNFQLYNSKFLHVQFVEASIHSRAYTSMYQIFMHLWSVCEPRPWKLAIQHFKCGDTTEVCNGIVFDFYMKLCGIDNEELCMVHVKKKNVAIFTTYH